MTHLIFTMDGNAQVPEAMQELQIKDLLVTRTNLGLLVHAKQNQDGLWTVVGAGGAELKSLKPAPLMELADLFNKSNVVGIIAHRISGTKFKVNLSPGIALGTFVSVLPEEDIHG